MVYSQFMLKVVYSSFQEELLLLTGASNFVVVNHSTQTGFETRHVFNKVFSGAVLDFCLRQNSIFVLMSNKTGILEFKMGSKSRKVNSSLKPKINYSSNKIKTI